MEPKYPNITVQLTNNDGNAYVILGRVTMKIKEKYYDYLFDDNRNGLVWSCNRSV